MERVRLEVLEGNEVLAKHIVTETGFELMSAGTVLKRDNISRHKELGYEYNYIKEQQTAVLGGQSSGEQGNHHKTDDLSAAVFYCVKGAPLHAVLNLERNER